VAELGSLGVFYAAEAKTADGGALCLALMKRAGVLGELEVVVGKDELTGSAAPVIVWMVAALAQSGANKGVGRAVAT